MRVSISLLLVLATGVAVGQNKKANPPKEAPVVKPREGKTETTMLFDGKTLDGWEGYTDLWSVKDGVIVAKNTDPLKFSTYLLTKQNYTDFRLTFAAKLVTSEMHSGVSFWGVVKPDVSKEPEKDRTKYTYAGHLVMFPSGYGMYDLFGRNGLPVDGGPAKKVGKQHDWNDIEILGAGKPGTGRNQRNGGRGLARSGTGADQRRANRPAVALQHSSAGDSLQGVGIGNVSQGRQAVDGEMKPV